MVSVRLEAVTKRYGETVALDRVSLDIDAGCFFFLLGPSGCGKTTLLRSIAGLLPLDGGRIFFDDKPVDHVPAHKRNTALVFQNYALWPHMTVFDNVAYGLVERKVRKAERKNRVRKALEMVRLADVAERGPAELSGGQQQRVALARALVVEPDAVLLDEPLSNLDAHLRHEMRYELKRIQRETGITMVYVTHDQKEALSMAHRIGVMDMGQVRQVGTPTELYQSPRNVFVARFVGQTNLVDATVIQVDGEFAKVDSPVGRLWGRATGKPVAEGQAVCCSIRPEAIRQANPDLAGKPASSRKGPDGGTLVSGVKDESGMLARVKGKLLRRLFLGEVEERFYQVGPEELKAVELAPRGDPPSEGQVLELEVDPMQVVVLPSTEDNGPDDAAPDSEANK